MNIDECLYSVMLTYPKGDTPISTLKPTHVFANITPNFRYSKLTKQEMDDQFVEACKKVMCKYHTQYADLAHGFRRAIIRIPFKYIKKYGEPVFISTSRTDPDQYVSYSVEQAREYAIAKKKKIDKQCKQYIKGMHEKHNDKRRAAKNNKKENKQNEES